MYVAKTEVEMLDLIFIFLKRYFQVTITFNYDNQQEEVIDFDKYQERFKQILSIRENLHRCFLDSGNILLEGFSGEMLIKKVRFISDGEKFIRFK